MTVRNRRPLCAGYLKDGSTPCNNSAQEGSKFCARHAGRPEAANMEPAISYYADEAHVDPELSDLVTPGSFRTALSSDLAESYEEVVEAIRAAVNAKRPMFFDCNGCSVRNTVHVPDHNAALKAADLWVSLGLGKLAPTAAEDDDPIDTDIDLHSMSQQERADLKRRLLKRLGGRDRYLAELERDTDDA